MKEKGQIAICSYKPKPGKQAELLALLHDHVVNLRMLGLASGFPRSLMTAADGAVIEIFQWDSEKSAHIAHENPKVKEMWAAIAAVADYVPLSSLPETQKPFAHFSQAANDRTNRVVHFEIEADEPQKVSDFYKQVFDWEFHRWGDNPYWLADTGREPCPGIDGAVLQRIRPEGGVANTIHVDSVDEYSKKVERAGGKICKPKFAIPGVGYLAYGLDPEDNVFGMMEPDMGAQ